LFVLIVFKNPSSLVLDIDQEVSKFVDVMGVHRE